MNSWRLHFQTIGRSSRDFPPTPQPDYCVFSYHESSKDVRESWAAANQYILSVSLVLTCNLHLMLCIKIQKTTQWLTDYRDLMFLGWLSIRIKKSWYIGSVFSSGDHVCSQKLKKCNLNKKKVPQPMVYYGPKLPKCILLSFLGPALTVMVTVAGLHHFRLQVIIPCKKKYFATGMTYQPSFRSNIQFLAGFLFVFL